MSTKPVPARPSGNKSASRQLPWRTDVEAARRAALKNHQPCVLILNVDSSAL